MLKLKEEKYWNNTVIKVIGIGGCGCNIVDRMYRERKNEAIEYIVANTDVQALSMLEVPIKLQLGVELTKGLGAGANPDVGQRAAQETGELIRETLTGADMIFITAGMGGGTGTGAAPIIAEISKETGALTVAVVTKPFHFEGYRRMRIAEQGLLELSTKVDTLITIPNQKLLSIIAPNTTLIEAFKQVDDILKGAVRGISDLITVPGLINLDFADVKTVMSAKGDALMGIGEGKGENRAIKAAEAAICSALLDNVSIDGAKGILINITGGPTLTLPEIDQAAGLITKHADKEALIIVGAVCDESLTDEIRITVIAAGFKLNEKNPILSMQPPVEKKILQDHKKIDISEIMVDEYEVPAYLRKKWKE